MLPKSLLSYRIHGAELVPAWLGSADHRWLAELRGVLAACHGLRRGEAVDRLEAVDLGPKAKRAMATHHLLGLATAQRSPISREAREVVFALAQARRDQGPLHRQEVLAQAARQLGLEDVEEALFADLPDQRRLSIPELPSVPELALEINAALAQGLVARALSLEVEVLGHSRPVVRQALLRRLLCVPRPIPEGVRLEISGAHSLFRRTILYGRRLASLLPVLVRCPRWSLRARLALRGTEATLCLGPTSPLPVHLGRDFDSKVEERLVADLRRLTADWEVVREPEPMPAGDSLVFPDLALVHRRHPERRALVEIVGFWTPDYLERKRARLHQAGLSDLILCVDERLRGGGQELPGEVLPFSKRVDAQALLQRVEALSTPTERLRLGPWDLFIDFAGRKPRDHAIHGALEGLHPGDGLRIEQREGLLLLVAPPGEPVAALSRRTARRLEPKLGRLRSVRLVRTIPWRSTDSGAGWRHLLKTSEWLLPEVELSLIPDPPQPAGRPP